MPRTAYEALPLLGLRTQKVATIAATTAGERIFAGTVDGGLNAYECRADTANAVRAGSLEGQQVETLRKPSSGKDKRPVTDLLAVEAWRALLGIMDGQLVAYDLYTYRPLASVPETKGCFCLCIDEGARMIYVANKKKLQVFAWQAVGVTLRREIPLSETPRAMACVPLAAGYSSSALVLALKKEYGALELASGTLTTALQLTEKEQATAAAAAATGAAIAGAGTTATTGAAAAGVAAGAAIIVPIRAAAARGPRVLVSAGARGVLLDLSGQQQREERLTWGAPPLTAAATGPFLAALLPPGRVEVHDLASLAPVQTVDVGGGACLATCAVGGGRAELAFVGGVAGVTLLKMVPLEFQVQTLVDAASFEEALSLCDLCRHDKSLLGSVDVASIHERYAYELFTWGDYDGAVTHFLHAETLLTRVVSLFPSLLPPDLPADLLHGGSGRSGAGGSGGGGGAESSRPLTGTSLSRAAAALTRFLERHRPEKVATADRVEAKLAAMGSSGGGSSSSGSSGAAGAMLASGTTARLVPEDAEALQQAALIDTLLVATRMQCNPARRDAIVQLLAGGGGGSFGGSFGGGAGDTSGGPFGMSRNRCHIESVAPLLAAGGLPFMEALLWLYRGRGQHRRVLTLLTEERCVGDAVAGGAGGWTRAEFRRWMAEYLRSLWFSEDPQHPPLALQAARPLLESDPELGLSIFTGSGGGASGGGGGIPAGGRGKGAARGEALQGNAGGSGGKGVPPANVFAFLKSVVVSPASSSAAAARTATAAEGASAASVAIPLASGRALAIRYLEHLVSASPPAGAGAKAAPGYETAAAAAATRPGASPLLHDELAYLLLEGTLAELEAPAVVAAGGAAGTTAAAAAAAAAFSGARSSPLLLGAVYRQRLQAFLQTSQHYNPARLLAVVPTQFLEEHALLLSRLGRHEEVLRIYVRQLRDPSLAERYCDRIWRSATAAAAASAPSTKPGAMAAAAEAFPGARLAAGVVAAAAAPAPAARLRQDQDVYLSLVCVYLAMDAEESGSGSDGGGSGGGVGGGGPGGGGGGKGLAEALALLERNFARVDAARALALLPADAPLSQAAPLLRLLLRHADSRRRTAAVVRQLARADYVNVRYELVQLQARVSRSPELALSFAHLGRLLRSCNPVDLADASAEYGVACIKHIFESHVVLQFNIVNHVSDHRLQNIIVHVEPSEPPGGGGGSGSGGTSVGSG
ncbi:unnamed protein product, partial [Phaeothamnion confervicola]